MERPITHGATRVTVGLDRLEIESYQRERVDGHYQRIGNHWDNEMYDFPKVIDLSPEGKRTFAVVDGQQRLAGLRLALRKGGWEATTQEVECLLLPYRPLAERRALFQKYNAATAKRRVDFDTTSRNAAADGDDFMAEVRRAYADLEIPTKGTTWAINSMAEVLAGAPDAYELATKVLQTYRDTYQGTAGRMTKQFYGAAADYFRKHSDVGARAVTRALNGIRPTVSDFQKHVGAILSDKGIAGRYHGKAVSAAGVEVIEYAVKRFYEGEAEAPRLRRVV